MPLHTTDRVMRFAIALMKPLIKPLSEGLMKPLSEGLSRQKTAAKSLLISRQKTAAKFLLIPFGNRILRGYNCCPCSRVLWNFTRGQPT